MDQYYEKNGERIKKFEIIGEGDSAVYKETEEWKQFRNLRLIKKRLEQSNLPPHVLNLSLQDYIGEDREVVRKLTSYVNLFSQKFCRIHLYFWSDLNSTQKTTLAGITGKELIKKEKSVQFILMGSLLKLLSNEQFETDEENLELLKRLRNCDFLIIDDAFDAKKSTIYKSGFQIPFLDEFLRIRLEIQQKAICFTSNFSVKEINEQVFGISLKKLVNRAVNPIHFGTPYYMKNDFNPDDLWN